MVLGVPGFSEEEGLWASSHGGCIPAKKDWKQEEWVDEMMLGKRWTGMVLVQCPLWGWLAEI